MNRKFCYVLAMVAVGRFVSAAEPDSDAKLSRTTLALKRELPTFRLKRIKYLSMALSHRAVAVRRDAAAALQRLDGHELAIPALVRALEDEDSGVRQGAGAALQSVGMVAVPAVTPGLDHERLRVRYSAAKVLLNVIARERERATAPIAPYLENLRQRCSRVVRDVLRNPAGELWDDALSEPAWVLRQADVAEAIPVLLDVLINDAQRRRRVARALPAIGLDALPALVFAAGHQEVKVREAALEGLSGYVGGRRGGYNPSWLVPVLEAAERDQSKHVSLLASRILSSIESAECEKTAGSAPISQKPGKWTKRFFLRLLVGNADLKPEAAIPALEKMVYEGEVLSRHYAAQILASYGEAARPHLLKALSDGDRDVRRVVLRAVRAQQPEFDAAVPLMIDALTSEHQTLRDSAARALQQMKPSDRKLIPALMEALEKDSQGVPSALAHFGAAIGPQLMRRIIDPDDPAGDNAAIAFSRLSTSPDERFIRSLIDRLGDENEKLSHRARRALQGAHRFTLPHLVAALNEHEDADVRRSVAEILAELRMESLVALPALFQALDDRNEYVRVAAAVAIAEIAPPLARSHGKIQQLTPILAEAALDPDAPSSLQPMKALLVIGPNAAPAIDQLIIASGSEEDVNVRWMAARVLATVGESALPALRKALTEGNTFQKQYAARALEEMGPAARAAVPELRELVHSPDEMEEIAAAKALTALDAARKEAMIALQNISHDPESGQRSTALKALGTLAAEYPPATKALIPFVFANEEHLRLIAIEALGETGSDASEVSTALQDALNLPQESVRRAAFLALQRTDPAAALKVAGQFDSTAP